MRLMATTALALALCLAACRQPPLPEPEFKPVPPVEQSGELVVLIRNGASSFYVDAEGKYAGLEYDLVTRFAEEMGVKVKFVVAPRVAEIPDKLARGEAHLAVGLLQGDDPRLVFSASYQAVQPVLVHHRDSNPPKSIGEIGERLLMVSGQLAPSFRRLANKTPGLIWHAADYQDSEELVEKVANHLIDYAVIDTHGAEAAQNFYPDVATAFKVGPEQPLSWAWPKTAPAEFGGKVKKFFDGIRKDGTLGRLLDRYYGHVKRLKPVDAQEFLARRVTVLPRYRAHFVEAEARYGIDWRLLAALAYQESHWDPFATSPYGVRGMMMLTNDTADRLGVDDRLDPYQSIMGGARYLQMLKDRLPPHIAEPDRTWLALASYNVGTAHLSDARQLAQRLGKNPDAWVDLKTVLPLLRNYEYFSTLKYGYARGGETVIFVEHLRSYHDILVRFERTDQVMFPPFDEQVSVANPEKVKLGIEARPKVKDGQMARVN
ncbi:membrane-bound lytic murein transglycosylase MltF [Chitinimonas lacunae]|uniref:Membrane-bound lytic murein transglycosylase F n=1 Tax=Chitinimonas lacunae TaxID=1963018 RepID=A0ABV8MXA2_9NEIS